MKDQLIRLLNDARLEILQLRKTNEILKAKSDVIDVFAKALNPPSFQGQLQCIIDIAWELERAANGLKEEIAADKQMDEAMAAAAPGAQTTTEPAPRPWPKGGPKPPGEEYF